MPRWISAKCCSHVGERIQIAGRNAPFELASAIDHLAKQDVEIGCLHLAVAAGRAQHRRESDGMETEIDEMIERGTH